jgi:chaperone required for assembly of F1-ATPase
MRDLLDGIFPDQPAADPTEAARRALRPQLRQRFYQAVTLTEGEGGFVLLLDGRPVRTPARRELVVPQRAWGEALAAEWEAQRDVIDPARMPLTRLANSIIDGVVDSAAAVAADVERYIGTDLVLYRAAGPDGLVARETAAWDPVLSWARAALGARLIQGQGAVFVAQSAEALAAARAAVPRDDIWRLGAIHAITTLTGSALIALALAAGALSVEQAWAAAHVDEDWNMDFWGRDALAMERRAARLAEMQAAAMLLKAR